MTAFEKLRSIQLKRGTNLCIGLDTDLMRIPKIIKKDISSIYEFNKKIIDATRELTAAYKLNFAFYEQYGAEGIEALKRTREYIPVDIFTVADAKRGDIGNTSVFYARSVFDTLGFDSVTVNPYLGYDSIEPFLSYSEKITFILTLTSNPGSNDFQRLMLDGEPLYMHIVKRCLNWGGVQNIGFVVGATHPAELSELRHIARNNYFLIPGIGAQGGNIGEVLEANATGPALINISRDIIYASSGDDFVEKVKERTLRYINLL